MLKAELKLPLGFQKHWYLKCHPLILKAIQWYHFSLKGIACLLAGPVNVLNKCNMRPAQCNFDVPFMSSPLHLTQIWSQTEGLNKVSAQKKKQPEPTCSPACYYVWRVQEALKQKWLRSITAERYTSSAFTRGRMLGLETVAILSLLGNSFKVKRWAQNKFDRFIFFLQMIMRISANSSRLYILFCRKRCDRFSQVYTPRLIRRAENVPLALSNCSKELRHGAIACKGNNDRQWTDKKFVLKGVWTCTDVQQSSMGQGDWHCARLHRAV